MSKQDNFPLHGWDDEKVYYWDEERKHEWCVSDDQSLYERLVQVCKEHFLETPGKDHLCDPEGDRS